jgi:uncharacterized protein (TIGR03790 family)
LNAGRAWLAGVLALAGTAGLRAAGGNEVAVIYNRGGGPDSVFVAEHYARVRNVPKERLIGLWLPRQYTITREQFDNDLRKPLVKELRERGLVEFQQVIIPARKDRPGRVVTAIVASRIRYLVLCYGVPVRIARSPHAADGAAPPGKNKVLVRDEAAVDSELACLGALERGASVAGPGNNPFYRTTVASRMTPPNGIFLVARLDGPTPDIARALVDKAVAAEKNGLWGRAWFDLRGLKNGGYKKGDDWIRAASETARELGFETVVDERGAVFPPGYPLPQVALYAGWYAGRATGPFGAKRVEFMPGAIAYHLHSFSAVNLRSPTANWVGPFLAHGVTATLGCVYEPYLSASPDVGVFFDRLLKQGFTFGEAAYACQPVLSWQTTVVGDPLYRPAAVSLAERAIELAGRTDEAAQWLLLQQLNRRLQKGGLTAEAAARELAAHPLTRRGAILQEKLGDLWQAGRHWKDAFRAYQAALKLKPTPEQEVLLQLKLARAYARAGRECDAVKVYRKFFKEHRRRPGLLAFYQEALPVARKARDARAVEAFEQAIRKLTPPPKK